MYCKEIGDTSTELPTKAPTKSEIDSGPVSYTFPEVKTHNGGFVHGICVMGATQVSASSTDTDLSYSSVPNFQNGMKLWSDRNYIAAPINSESSNKGIVGDEFCQGGNYLKPSKHKAIGDNTVTVEATSSTSKVTLCAFVTPESRAGDWDSTLPDAGFHRSSVRFQWSGSVHERPYMYCKEIGDNGPD